MMITPNHHFGEFRPTNIENFPKGATSDDPKYAGWSVPNDGEEPGAPTYLITPRKDEDSVRIEEQPLDVTSEKRPPEYWLLCPSQEIPKKGLANFYLRIKQPGAVSHGVDLFTLGALNENRVPGSSRKRLIADAATAKNRQRLEQANEANEKKLGRRLQNWWKNTFND